MTQTAASPVHLDHESPVLRPAALRVVQTTDGVDLAAAERAAAEFLHALDSHPDLDTVVLPIGNGEALTYKKP